MLNLDVNCYSQIKKCQNSYKVRGEEDGGEGDQGGQHHLRRDLRATAPHDGCEDLKHHPDEEHEVDVWQRQAQQVKYTVLKWCSCQ